MTEGAATQATTGVLGTEPYGDAMKTLWVLALVCIACVAAQGCKWKKREPVPGPQVSIGRSLGTQAGSNAAASRGSTVPHTMRATSGAVRQRASSPHAGAGGIAWFQGSVEEAFSRPAPTNRCPC
ncbi:MAG TPA: hypothetical protein VIY54_10255 [Steroidobacteraceae bacterium]